MKKYIPLVLRQSGHTLLEIMFSIAIIAILSSMAFPSVTTVVNNASIRSTRELLLQDIRLLRSYSRSQHKPSYLCARDPQQRCVRQANWNDGWIGFIDNNQSHHLDEGDEVVIEYQPADLRQLNIINHSRWKEVNIDTEGIIRSSGHFRICNPHKAGTHTMKVIRMNVHGRLAVESDTLDCV